MIGSVRVFESRFVQSCTNIANAPQISNAEIAILGRSNVGKSSLINALLNNKNLAKSSSTPGKTRLVNFFVSRWEINSYQKNSSLQETSLRSFWATPFGDFGNLGRFADAPVQSHAPNSQKTSQFPPQILELDSSKSDSGESTPFRHTERSEVSKSRESNAMQSIMIQKRINESHRFAQSQRIVGDSRIAKMDSSLRTSCYAQNDESMDCFGDKSPRNDDSAYDLHKSPQDEFAQKAEFVIHILDFPGFGYAKVSKSERDSWDKNLSTFLKKRESIKLFIHLIDSRHTNLALDNEIRAFLRSIVRADADILEVFTKADKLKKSEIHALKGRILVSTTKKDLGQGDLKDSIESLRHAILRTMYHI